MNRPIPLTLPLAALLVCLPLAAARAQVTSNLDDLPQARPVTPVSRPKPPHASHPAQPAARKAATSSVPDTQVAPSTKAAQPVVAHSTVVPGVPPAPPPPVVLPPPFVPIQTHPPVPPATIQPVADATSKVSSLPDNGLRVTFGSGTAALNADSIKAIETYGADLAQHPERRVILIAHATLPGDDISMPRRISLARALAVRSLLIQKGVATTRIYPRALGRPASDDTAPPDRLDVIVETNASPTP